MPAKTRISVAARVQLSGALLGAVLICLVPSAGLAQPSEIFAEPTKTLSVPDATSPSSAVDVRIGPLDKLKIDVFGVQSLSREYQVDQNGKLRLPLIGELDVKGYTPSELSVLLEQKYEAQYIQRADVNVLVTESNSAQLTVEGTVKKPGMFPVKGQLTLLQALAMAGGPDDTANLKRVMVFRNIEGKRRVAVFNLTDVRRGKAEDPQVYGNDIVVVDGSGTSRGYREFLKSIPLVTMFGAF